ncbi:MAG: DNRLRE domain-containing protein, partial [Actinobacteria bacterium]|nr:DNRLRE domain-containing protein [Actinomycetota bacterium]
MLVLEAPTAADSPAGDHTATSPASAAHATMTATHDGAADVFTVSVDPDWLNAPERRFPVLLDPTITVQPDAQDASFPATCAGCTPYVSNRLYIGSSDTNTWRGAVQFDLAGVPAGAAVTGASLGLYFDGYCMSATGAFCGGTSHPIDAHRMTGPWTTGSTTSQLAFDPAPLSTYTLAAGAPQGWMTWPVTSTVQGWLNGTQANNGLLLKRQTETTSSSGPVPPSRSFTASPSLQPKLDITYTSDAVTLLPVDTVHSNGADLRWTKYAGPSGAPFSQYQVHRSASSTFTPSAATLLTTIADPAVVAYRDTTARPGSQFTYKITANGAPSNGVSVTTTADGQAQKTLQPDPNAGQDTYLYYAAGITNCANYGRDSRMFLGADTGGTYRPLVKFDLADIPAKAAVTSASLALWQLYSDPQAVTAEAHRVTREWTAGTGTGSPATCTHDGATWYDATGTTPWTANGGDVDPAVAASVAKPANQPAGFDTFDITALAQQWANGSAPNLGVAVRLASETAVSGNSLAYASADTTSSPSLRPRLTVVYADGSHALPPATALAAPAAGSTLSGTVSLTATASDDGAVDHVDLLVDGTAVGTATAAPYTSSWNSTAVSNGSHTVAARAVDTAGNTATSPGTTVTVDNTPPPTASVTGPTANSTVSGNVAVTASGAASSPATVAKVEFFVDNRRFATATASPYTATWNTLDPAQPAYDGTHALTAQTTDSTGRTTASAPVTVTVANTAGTLYRAAYTPTAIPPALTYDPALTTQPTSGVDVTVTNNSTTNWNTGDKLNYRWVSPDPAAAPVAGSAVTIGTGVPAGGTATVRLPVAPPALPDGVNSAAYQLTVDAYDTTTAKWFADKGNAPVSTGVTITRKTQVGLGLEKYYQYEGQPAGGGATALTNAASGNMLLRWTPFDEPGRGLASVLDLTYNSLEQHSNSPAGNNVSLALSSLTRLGTPIDFHPNNADTISGRSNKYAIVTDGDGTALRFDGTTTTAGTTWAPPPGVHLYLRAYNTADPNKYWALSRPDKVTFFYTQDGFPTSVVDKNGNALTLTETATPPGDDPGGQKQRVTAVTDAGGRAFTIAYYGKDETKKAQQRGKIKDVTDHNGHVLHLDYYEDGNLLRITQSGGTKADGSALPARAWTLTYMTSNGAAAAIPLPADRVNPDPKTPNENSQVYSLRDPLGRETTFGYWQNSDGPFLAGRLKTRTDRTGQQTAFAYDSTASTTTVTAPLSRVTKYGWDSAGRPVSLTNPKNETTAIAWTADNQVQTITEPNNATRTYAYNANGYLTASTDQEGNRTELGYLDRALDSTDTGTHWSLLASKTAPNGVATTTVAGDYQYTFGYDAAGNVTTTTEPGNYTTSYCYNLATAPACNTANDAGSPGTVRAVTRPNGGVTTYSGYDPSGLPQTVTDPLGRASKAGYSPDGLTLWTQDPAHAAASGSDTRAYRTYFDYDAFRRLGRTSTPKSTAADRGNLVWTSTAYDANDNPTSTSDAHYGAQDAGNGAVTAYAYDPMDRLTLTTGPDTTADPVGERTATAYDAAGRPTKVTSPKGMTTTSPDDFAVTYGYDALDRVVSTTTKAVDSAGTVVDTRTGWNCYDNTGNVTSTTAPNANLTAAPACPATAVAYTTKYGYDRAHRRTGTTDPGGRTATAAYDADGNTVTSADLGGSTTTTTYDQRDKPVKTVSPYVHGGRGTTTLTAYDGDGNRTSTVSPRGYDAAADRNNISDYVTRYGYDLADQLVKTTLPAD